jgi:ABC-type antimicrobial peptide transport system permease subunit
VRSATSRPVDIDAVKAAVRSVRPDQSTFHIQPLSEATREPAAYSRTVAALLGAFAALALFMSVTGVYSVVTYLTSRRTKEVAIRVAIGAKARDVVRLVGGQTLLWTAGGLVAGLMGSFAAASALRRILPDVIRVEPLTLVLVCGLYLAVVAAAISVPALKALRVDPGLVLRTD